MMCSNSYINHYIKVGQHPKCVISSIERAGQPLVKQAVSSAEICTQIELADLIMLQKRSKYNLDDMIFWLVCAYLHGTAEQNVEESDAALQRINHLISNGMPGGKTKVEQIIENVKRHYPEYIKNPS